MRYFIAAAVLCSVLTGALVWLDARSNRYSIPGSRPTLESLQASILAASETPALDIGSFGKRLPGLQMVEMGEVSQLFELVSIAPHSATKHELIYQGRTVAILYVIQPGSAYPIILTESYNQQDVSGLRVTEYDPHSYGLVSSMDNRQIRLVIETKDSILALSYRPEENELIAKLIPALPTLTPRY